MWDALLNIEVYTSKLIALIELSSVKIMLGLAIIGYLVELKQGVRNTIFFLIFFIAHLSMPALYKAPLKDYYFLIFTFLHGLLAFAAWFFGKLYIERQDKRWVLWLRDIDRLSEVMVYSLVVGMFNNFAYHLIQKVLEIDAYRDTYSLVAVSINLIVITAMCCQFIKAWSKDV